MSQWKIVPGVNLYYVTTTIVDWQYVFTGFPHFEVVLKLIRKL